MALRHMSPVQASAGSETELYPPSNPSPAGTELYPPLEVTAEFLLYSFLQRVAVPGGVITT